MKQITYYFKQDIVYISLSADESTIGDEDFQDGVILLRDQESNIVGIEIIDFTSFKEDKIRASEEECWDLSKVFLEIRMLISLRDIMFSYYEKEKREFEDTCKAWGIQTPTVSTASERSPYFSFQIEDIPLLHAAA